MSKLKAFVSRVPRPVWILINILAIAVVLFLSYVFAGTPAYSIEQAYRRAEKGNLVGPAKILDIIEVDMSGYNHLLLADDGDGVILYTYLISSNKVSSESGQLVYREKTGGVTVVPAPAYGLTFTGISATLPVIVFDEYPDAVRAELDISLYEIDTGSDAPVMLDFSLTSSREADGYFRFDVSYFGEDYRGKEVQMINDLGYTSAYGNRLSYAYPAKVRLYNAQNVMLYEQSLVIRTRAGYAHERDD